MKPQHTWDVVALDAGLHHCTVCGATNEELAPTCELVQLTAEQRSAQRADNLRKYGARTWLITVYRGADARVDTLMRPGLVVVPT